jgi:hypothetical protein
MSNTIVLILFTILFTHLGLDYDKGGNGWIILVLFMLSLITDGLRIAKAGE